MMTMKRTTTTTLSYKLLLAAGTFFFAIHVSSLHSVVVFAFSSSNSLTRRSTKIIRYDGNKWTTQQQSSRQNPRFLIDHHLRQLIPAPRQQSKICLPMLSTPLISATDTWGNISSLCGASALAQVIGKTTQVGRLLGPPVTAMALTFLFASIGILNPGGTTSSKALQLLSLQLATPLILLGADLRDCIARCGPLLPSFFVAAVATVIACICGWSVAGTMMTNALGRDGLIIAAALMAKNIGGGINYIAVCRCLSASPTAVAAGLCVDNIFALIYFPATNAIGAGRPDVNDDFESPADDCDDDDDDDTHVKSRTSNQPEISIQNVSSALFLASMLLWLGEKIGGISGALPCCTVLTVIFASKCPRKWIAPVQPAADILGTCALYLFFATAGSPGIAVADSVKASLIPISIFLSFLYAVHGSILYTLHRIWGNKIPSFVPQRLLVSSSAAIGGPATSAALCQAHGWKSLLVPSLIVGNIGYAIATFCALAYHSLLRPSSPLPLP